MAIDKVERVTLVSPANDLDALQQRLYDLSVMHIADAHEHLSEDEGRFSRPTVDTQSVERRIGDLSYIESVFDQFAPRRQSIIESFAPLPMSVTRDQLAEHLHWDGREALAEECREVESVHNSAVSRIAEIDDEIGDLSLFVDLPFDLADLRALERFQAWIGRIPMDRWREMMQAGDTEDLLDAELIRQDGKQAVIVAAAPADRATEALNHLRRYGFLEMQIPDLTQPPEQQIVELETERAERETERDETEARATRLADEHRDRIHVLRGYWESEQHKLTARNRVAVSQRVGIITGYVRKRDLDTLARGVEADFPGVDILCDEPAPDEMVPVSLTTHPVFRPGKFLVNMFGLPDYYMFDPTAFIVGVYVILFGICFGDTIYGLGLMGVCWWLMKKYRDHETVSGFFQLFFYCGIATTLVGFFTGSWAGDLYRFLPDGNPISLLRDWMARHGLLLDLVNKPIVGLLIALAVGVLNQYYGIVLRMYRDWRRGQKLDAVLDGGLWIIVLTGMLILVAGVFGDPPAALVNTGKWGFIIGALGLVLTQGRKEKGIPGKAATGVISVYGILGTYGCSTFLGDMLSYSRLLALGLTTSIVASSFNLIGNIVREVISGTPVVGGVLGIVVFIGFLIFGHVFNFFISILSAFVHSARLLFLEMFGRFYETGGNHFAPLGFHSDRVRIRS